MKGESAALKLFSEAPTRLNLGAQDEVGEAEADVEEVDVEEVDFEDNVEETGVAEETEDEIEAGIEEPDGLETGQEGYDLEGGDLGEGSLGGGGGGLEGGLVVDTACGIVVV